MKREEACPADGTGLSVGQVGQPVKSGRLDLIACTTP
ncbi:hypothetical protein DSC45_05370 [Streptomyces sp. YIM 130001]|nr:hypothetical protein DSC45_05370 [Streptomyces sp. YIM 130001]